MRKVIVLTIAIILMAGLGFAQDNPTRDFISSLPDVRTGVAWDMTKDANDLVSITTVDVVKWGKGKFGMTEDKLCLGAGVLLKKIGDIDYVDPCASLSWHIGGLENLGFSYPLKGLIDIEIGVFAGRGFQDDDWKAGLQTTILRF